MLLTRVLTAAVLLPLVIGAIFLMPSFGVALLLAAFLLVGAWEWAGFMQLGKAGRVIFTALVAGLFLLCWLGRNNGLVVDGVIAAGVVWWLYAAWLVYRFPRGWDLSVGLRPISGAIGCLILVCGFVSILEVHALGRGPEWLLLLFLLIWGADTGAYFAGRALGRHKLAPRVSPGKTIEGAIGGLAACAVVANAGSLWFGLSGGQALLLPLLGVIIAPVSILGDLTESMFKRQAGLKDSGQIFPGHGGVLDRLDSLLAAAPFFLAGLYVLGIAA